MEKRLGRLLGRFNPLPTPPAEDLANENQRQYPRAFEAFVERIAEERRAGRTIDNFDFNWGQTYRASQIDNPLEIETLFESHPYAVGQMTLPLEGPIDMEIYLAKGRISESFQRAMSKPKQLEIRNEIKAWESFATNPPPIKLKEQIVFESKSLEPSQS